MRDTLHVFSNTLTMVLYIKESGCGKAYSTMATGNSSGTAILDTQTMPTNPRRKWKSGTVAKRQIKKLTRSTNTLLPRAAFHRLVRELTQDCTSVDMRWSVKAMQAIQDATECYITESLQRANTARGFAGHKTLSLKDLQYSHSVAGLMAGQEI